MTISISVPGERDGHLQVSRKNSVLHPGFGATAVQSTSLPPAFGESARSIAVLRQEQRAFKLRPATFISSLSRELGIPFLR